MQIPTQSVVGYCRLSVNDQEALLVLAAAKKKGRYLTPPEISFLLRRELAKTIEENEEVRMRRCWTDFCRAHNLDQYSPMTEIDVFEKWWAWIPENWKAEPAESERPW